MDDLTAAISQILQNPDSMNQLRAAAQALGLDPDGPPPPGFEQFAGKTDAAPSPQQEKTSGQTPAAPTIDLSALAGLLGGGQVPRQPSIDPATLKLIAGAVSKLNSSDKDIDLLRALKPHFSSARAGRVDDAIRLLQLFSMLPVLRESGILNRFLGGGDSK